ncbi:unnamed protein product [Triticum turgidum subsp. durum]|uniref:Uncharacterized protein n=1 Tax=Triticum turgidum subsp. durum TaxID=4567 RepID=A0A9R0XN96_TRITD|nr:unnamed protein product [Triticum turgidum subsp. durum]
MSSRTRGYLACTYHSHLACAAAQGPSHRHHCDVAIESIFTVGGEVLLGPQEPRRLQPPELATRAAAGRGRCYARGGRVRVSHARSPLSRPRASLLLSCRRCAHGHNVCRSLPVAGVFLYACMAAMVLQSRVSCVATWPVQGPSWARRMPEPATTVPLCACVNSVGCRQLAFCLLLLAYCFLYCYSFKFVFIHAIN